MGSYGTGRCPAPCPCCPPDLPVSCTFRRRRGWDRLSLFPEQSIAQWRAKQLRHPHFSTTFDARCFQTSVAGPDAMTFNSPDEIENEILGPGTDTGSK